MNFIQPSIDPIIFSIGYIDIRWYSMAYIIGLILGLILIKKLNKAKGGLISVNKLDNFFIWAVMGTILGGRIGYVIFYQTTQIIVNPIYIIQIWNGGMSFHGGLIGVILSTYIYCKINKINFLYLSDLVSTVAPIGLFLGRVANFINSELIGKTTDFYISIIFPTIDNLPRHPSQLYEAFFEGIILFILLNFYFYKNINSKKYGNISGLFLIFYSTFRFFIEFLREPDSHIGLLFNFFSMGQLLSLPLFIFGIILVLKNANHKSN